MALVGYSLLDQPNCLSTCPYGCTLFMFNINGVIFININRGSMMASPILTHTLLPPTGAPTYYLCAMLGDHMLPDRVTVTSTWEPVEAMLVNKFLFVSLLLFLFVMFTS